MSLRGEVWFYQIFVHESCTQKLLNTLLMNDLAFHVFVCMKCFVGTLDMDMHVGLSFLVFLVPDVWGGGTLDIDLSKGRPQEMTTNTCCKC